MDYRRFVIEGERRMQGARNYFRPEICIAVDKAEYLTPREMSPRNFMSTTQDISDTSLQSPPRADRSLDEL